MSSPGAGVLVPAVSRLLQKPGAQVCVPSWCCQLGGLSGRGGSTGCGPASTAARGVTLPRLCSATGLGSVRLARSPALFCLFWLHCLALPCPGWLAAPLRTGNGSSVPEGRSSRDRTAPSAGMQPQPSLCSSASKCEGGTFWLPSPWLVLKPPRGSLPELSTQPSCPS